MRDIIHFLPILLSAILAIGVTASPLEAAAARPVTLKSRQASRESIVARAIAVSRGLKKRQNPSAIPT